jgi:hypothetical protein
MRLSGMKVRGMLFVPLLGAATLPEHGFASRWDEARVALAGPVTGLPVAGVLGFVLLATPVAGQADPTLRSALAMAVLWALGVNFLNLLPAVPLDGGRVLSCLTASLPAVVRGGLAFAPIAGLAIVMLLARPGEMLIPGLLFVFVAAVLTRAMLRRQSVQAWMHALPNPLASLRASLRDVTHAVSGKAREDVDGGVAPTPLSGGQTVVVLAVYVVEAALLLAAASLCESYLGLFERLKDGG